MRGGVVEAEQGDSRHQVYSASGGRSQSSRTAGKLGAYGKDDPAYRIITRSEANRTRMAPICEICADQTMKGECSKALSAAGVILVRAIAQGLPFRVRSPCRLLTLYL